MSFKKYLYGTSIICSFLFGCQNETTSSENVSEEVKKDTVSTPEEVTITYENVPIYKDKVTDHSGLFKESQRTELIDICNRIVQNSKYPVFVVTIPDTGGEDIESYSLKTK